MGKSTVCSFFRELGTKTWSADDAVHELYSKGGEAISKVSKLFPSAIDENGAISRESLSKLMVENPRIVGELEKIVHPLVKAHREKFILMNSKENILVFDIPLLFETNSMDEFDKIVVVDCDPKTQKERVLARPGMSEKKFETILSRQIPNHLKAEKADFIIDTNRPLSEVKEQVKHVLDILGQINA